MVPWPLGTREVPVITLQSGLPISHSKLKALRLKTWKDTLLGLKRFSELLPLLSQFLPDFQSGKLSQSPPPPPPPHTQHPLSLRNRVHLAGNSSPAGRNRPGLRPSNAPAVLPRLPFPPATPSQPVPAPALACRRHPGRTPVLPLHQQYTQVPSSS